MRASAPTVFLILLVPQFALGKLKKNNKIKSQASSIKCKYSFWRVIKQQQAGVTTEKTGLTAGRKESSWMERQEKRKEAAYFAHTTAAGQPLNTSCKWTILVSLRRISTRSCHEKNKVQLLHRLYLLVPLWIRICTMLSFCLSHTINSIDTRDIYFCKSK